MQTVGLLPGEQHLGRGAGLHRQRRADGDGIAQTHRAIGGRHADALVALAAEELGALVRVVAQRAEDGPGGGEQAVLTGGGGEFDESGAEDEASLHVTGHEAVMLQRDREAVGGRASEAGGCDELGEGGGPCLEGGEHDCSLVEDSDAT